MRFFGRLAVAFALSLTCGAIPGIASADDRSSVDTGRTAGRAILVLRDPKVCAIALLHDRCRADVQTLIGDATDADFQKVPHIGPHPITGLRAFIDDGDRDAFDRALVYLNSKSATAALWAADPRSATLYDAGVEDVLFRAAGDNVTAQVLSVGPVADLLSHAKQIPSGVLAVNLPATPSSGATANGTPMLAVAREVVRAIDRTIPTPALANVAGASGPASVAALGVASSTVGELIDSPAWLFQADAQRYVDTYATRMRTFAPSAGPQIDALRAAAQPGSAFSHANAIAAYNGLMSVRHSADAARERSFVFGSFAAQMMYNAAILRDANASSTFTRFLGAAGPLDTAVPGWTAARQSAGTVGATDWRTQYRLGMTLVGLIEKANGQ